jgi:hypothetical protein
MAVSEEVAKTIMLTPNPATAGVKITGAENATVEIYDILGNHVVALQAEGDLQWNCRTAAGELVPAGSYIVRIAGQNAENIPFVVSKRLVIER